MLLWILEYMKYANNENNVFFFFYDNNNEKYKKNHFEILRNLVVFILYHV